MNVPTIEMDPEQAQTKLAAYRTQLRRRADEEYEAAAAGYAALAEGKHSTSPKPSTSLAWAKTAVPAWPSPAPTASRFK